MHTSRGVEKVKLDRTRVEPKEYLLNDKWVLLLEQSRTEERGSALREE